VGAANAPLSFYEWSSGDFSGDEVERARQDPESCVRLKRGADGCFS
jgi:hypothetical protein